MGKDLNVKFGASLVIVVMLMASIVGFIGIGTAATENNDSNEATEPIMISKDNLRKVEITTPELLVPRVYPDITKTAGDPYPSPQAFPFQDADTTRCVLNELYATMDYGGLLPAIKGAYNDLDNGMYTTSEAFFMEWHCDMEQILTPPPPPWNDTEYDPGHYMFVPPWSDSCARILQPAPLGLDMTLWQILTGAGEYVPVPSAAVDGEIYEYTSIWYQDALESTAPGSVGETRRDDIVAMLDPRLATETPVTIAVNGTFNGATDWGNMTVTVAAIGDLPTTNIVVDFFIAEEHNSEIEVRFNPIDGVAANEDWSNKNYYMNKVGRRWAGMGEPNTGGPPYFLYEKTDTVTYVDVPFDDHWQWGGASMGWIGNNLWLVASVINGDTGEVLQTSAFSIGNPMPDLYITPVDVFWDFLTAVLDEHVYGPATGGEIGPFWLANSNIFDCHIYIDDGGEVTDLIENVDFYMNYTTGYFMLDPGAAMSAGSDIYAHYNHSAYPPSEGDIVPFDVRVSNTGNGAAGASTLQITNGDGGPVIDTLAVPALAAGESWDGNWNFDTTGYTGFLTLCFIPDGPDAVAESDENNNIAPYDLYVAPPIDVGVESIDSHADGGTYEWGPTTIQATVKNYGITAQGPFNVQCTVMEGATTILQEIKPTTGTLNQAESEQLSWNTNLNSIAAYDITIETQLVTDTIPANDIMTITINTQNTIAPAEATHLRIWPGGGGTIYNNYTVDQDNPDHGVVTPVANGYQNVDEIDPPDALTEDVLEVITGGDVWNNYTVASDIGVEGTVGGTAGPPYWQNIDENPPTGDVETVQEIFVGSGGDAFANVVGATDNTGDLLADIQADDAAGASPPSPVSGDGWYTADKGDVLFMDGFNTAGMSGTVTGATLEVQYSVEDGFGPTSDVQWALDGGGLASTGITPTNGQEDFVDTYDLFAQGVDTLAEIATLDIEFTNNDGGQGDSVSFDYMKVIVTVASSYSAEHKWTTDVIPAGYDALNLYVRGMHNVGSDDTFSIEYSTDDISYNPTGITIAATSLTDYGPFAFPGGLSGSLYLRVVDDNTGDAVQQDTVEIDTIRLEWYQNVPLTASLEHRWRTEDVSAGSTTLDLYVTGMTNGGSDDSFSFGYSNVLGGPYTPVLTVPAGAAMATYSAALPLLSGQFYLNVIDDNLVDGTADEIFIDTIRIEQSIVPGGSTNQVAIQDIPVQGTVTPVVNGYLETTSIPPDNSPEQIEEVLSGGVGPREDVVPIEDFTAGMPAGWSEYDAGGSVSANTWIWVDATTPPTQGDSLCYWINWEALYNNRALETQAYDFTIYTAVELNFEHFMSGTWGDVMTIQYDTTGGGASGTWNTITSWTADGTWTDWTIRSNIDCSAVDGLSNVRFRFLYTANDGNSNGVDYVQITGVPDTSQASLEHTWRMQDFAGPSLSRTLVVTARTDAVSDDGFTFGYSVNSIGPFTPVITVPSTQSTFATYSVSIPAGITGEFYINVFDTNTLDNTLDSVYVDMIRIEIFGSPDVNDCTIRWDLSADDGGAGYDDIATYDIYRSDSADGTYYEGAYIHVDSVASGTQVWVDLNEGLDLVDNIWYYVIANDGSFTSPPTGIVSKLDVLPETYNVLADGVSPLTILIGTLTITLTADIRDNTTLDEYDPFLIGADWYDPLSTDGGAIAAPVDLTWDGPYESISEVIDTSAWGAGDHIIEVRGNSSYGWGPVSTVTVTVNAPISTYDINLAGVAADTWVFVSFPITATGNVTTVFDDANWGDGGTTWDYIQWYDNLNKEWRSYSIYKPASINDVDIIDNTYGFWIHITGNLGDQNLTVGSGIMPAGPVFINLYTGWNLVGYPSATPIAGDLTLPAEADLVAVYDLGQAYRIRDELKSAVTFTGGNAYWVRVTSNCVWTVNP